ncbi:cation diffusion facilitator CzcD-associated flavoprotein CzcO [Kribbella orskensis]|uniref:Cation diffusion facilitator CzcD-associated flavoprotein CzcO n=1 Tax=Kribbella orskensis TaxID=2512216 RepID=A0ABY2B9K3_9ACTN|nr:MULTISPECIES: NAD(P)/FAD-dependent oxidoreductase [Kribbella]TCN32231.1 cation diffusion facilitator CzcD-associated flavoprotein CzcO [Kribbella sp. VKM Ac-2500]TCO12674.1 cation diffusion facilitator CzcD-associated flavoprotein CzcO [Kribbella orskensis]
MEQLDVLVVGAGLSGIGAAYRLQTQSPQHSYAVLEAREDLGGTWDLFRYPGVRSDSDMFTLGFPFHPWTAAKAIADGPSILEYLHESATTYGIDKNIRFGRRVLRASWSSSDALWTVETSQETYTCSFLYVCSGYYNYDSGYVVDFPGLDEFQGRVVHPQQWPEDLDYSGQRVVVIGSGATAVTLVPAMAPQAAHVTMLQRTPSYVASRPAKDAFSDRLRAVLPEKLAHRLIRGKNVAFSSAVYSAFRRWPAHAAWLLNSTVAKQLPDSIPADPHFTPRYKPWDQRLCLVPDADLFESLRDGSASVVTDEIDTFTANGIRLRSGDHLEADLVVTATGLQMVALGKIELTVDGERVDPHDTFVYKGMMLSGVPNLAWCIGYTNNSWTLRSDLTSQYVCRLLNHLDRTGSRICVPEIDPAEYDAPPRPVVDLSSGYIRRAASILPRQGSYGPWRLRQNYPRDLVTLRYGSLDDGTMHFRSAAPQPVG